MRSILAILFATATLCHGAESIAGRWEGSAQIPGAELKLIVDLALGDERWVGSIIVPGFGVKGAPLTDLVVDKTEVTFFIKGALGNSRSGQAQLKAHLSGDTRLTGEFLQGGNRAPLFLERTGLPQVDLPPRNTVVSKDLEGEWKGEYELNGYPRHVTMKFVNHGKDGAAVDFIIVGKKTNQVPVSLLTQEGDFLSVTSDEFRITYEGRIRGEAGEIKGTFTQGPFELPLVMRRAL